MMKFSDMKSSTIINQGPKITRQGMIEILRCHHGDLIKFLVKVKGHKKLCVKHLIEEEEKRMKYYGGLNLPWEEYDDMFNEMFEEAWKKMHPNSEILISPST